MVAIDIICEWGLIWELIPPSFEDDNGFDRGVLIV
jgi:hypothetical protein